MLSNIFLFGMSMSTKGWNSSSAIPFTILKYEENRSRRRHRSRQRPFPEWRPFRNENTRIHQFQEEECCARVWTESEKMFCSHTDRISLDSTANQFSADFSYQCCAQTAISQWLSSILFLWVTACFNPTFKIDPLRDIWQCCVGDCM